MCIYIVFGQFCLSGHDFLHHDKSATIQHLKIKSLNKKYSNIEKVFFYFFILLPPFFLLFFSQSHSSHLIQLIHCAIKYPELNFSMLNTVKSLWRRSPVPHSLLSTVLRHLFSNSLFVFFPRVLCSSFCYSQQGP